MNADRVEISWDGDKSEWMAKIVSGEEVIWRHFKLPKNVDEQTLRTEAHQIVLDEGYEPNTAELLIRS